MEAIVAKDNLPTWDNTWDDFVQEETRRGLVQGSSSTSREDEKNVALQRERRSCSVFWEYPGIGLKDLQK